MMMRPPDLRSAWHQEVSCYGIFLGWIEKRFPPLVRSTAKADAFLGKYAKASRRLYERNGTRAIVINQIEELKDVHLTIEDR